MMRFLGDESESTHPITAPNRAEPNRTAPNLPVERPTSCVVEPGVAL